jgi:tetratricopeptide (TPR) repeat protein
VPRVDGTELPPALRQRFAALEARVEGLGTSGEDREAVKADIAAFYKSLDAELAAIAALKEDVKRLADRWKATHRVTPPALATRAPVQADHLNASSFIEKGWSRISAGDYAGAEAALNRALELSPNDAQSESLLGWAQMHQEKYDDALLHFQSVLQREPTNALARINVGYICLKKRIFGEAIEHLSRALRLDGDRKAMLYAHFYLGLVYLEREMYDDAQTFFRRALELGPNLIEAYYELGRALWFSGRRDQAQQAWRDGRAANKFNPWGKRCAELLTTVEGGGEPPRVGAKS